MRKTLTARLDEKTTEQLARLAKTLGISESAIVREGIQLMATFHPISVSEKPKFIGIGMFASGKNDLASNKKHLDNFGK